MEIYCLDRCFGVGFVGGAGYCDVCRCAKSGHMMNLECMIDGGDSVTVLDIQLSNVVG